MAKVSAHSTAKSSSLDTITNLSVMALRLYVQLLHIGDERLTVARLKGATKAKTTAELEASIKELYTAGLLDKPMYTLHFRGIPIAAVTKTEAYGLGDGQIRAALITRVRDSDGLPTDEGKINQPSSAAYRRRQAQIAALRDAWRYLYPEDAAFPLVDANRLINLCDGSGEQVMDYMFTIYDAPHKKEVTSPRALLRKAVENAASIGQSPKPEVSYRGPYEKRRIAKQSSGKRTLPWAKEKNKAIVEYANGLLANNPKSTDDDLKSYYLMAQTAVLYGEDNWDA